jgi:uncharacterized protein YkwD
MREYLKIWRKSLPNDESSVFARFPSKGKRTSRSSRVSGGLKVLLLVAIAAVAVPGFVEGGCSEKGALECLPCREPLSRDAVIGLTNDARKTEGLTALDENPLLDTIAEARAKDMLEKQYFAHVSPTGDRAARIAQKVGYRYRLIAENIASGVFFTNRKLLDAWMQSPGHRNNILSPRVRELGVSVVEGRMNGAKVWVCVQLFGLRSTPMSERPLVSARREPSGRTEMREATAEGLREGLERARRELDAERGSIERDLGILAGDPGRSQDLNMRIGAYNAKADRYNRSLAEMNVMKAELDRTAQETGRRDTVTEPTAEHTIRTASADAYLSRGSLDRRAP